VDLATNLVGGIVSSLIAVALVEAYSLVRKALTQRPLKILLGRASRVGIAVPDIPIEVNERTSSIIALHDSFALAHLLEACGKIRAQTVVASTSRLPDDLPKTLISVGRPYSNPTTRAHLTRHCQGFLNEETEDGIHRYQIGSEILEESADTTWGFIVRLDSEVTQREGDLLLIWGASALGTAAAAYYFAVRPEVLVQISRASLFVAINVNPRLGYRAVPTSVLDLTADAIAS
jgi:hypothetical protein